MLVTTKSKKGQLVHLTENFKLQSYRHTWLLSDGIEIETEKIAQQNFTFEGKRGFVILNYVFTCNVITSGPVFASTFFLTILSVGTDRTWGITVNSGPSWRTIAFSGRSVTSAKKRGFILIVQKCKNCLQMLGYFYFVLYGENVKYIGCKKVLIQYVCM